MKFPFPLKDTFPELRARMNVTMEPNKLKTVLKL